MGIVRICHQNVTQTVSKYLLKQISIANNAIECCARQYLSIQPDFLAQKCEIEEVIKNSSEGQYHMVLYYPKFHCELNHIEHYWCHCKAYARHHCEYSLENFEGVYRRHYKVLSTENGFISRGSLIRFI